SPSAAQPSRQLGLLLPVCAGRRCCQLPYPRADHVNDAENGESPSRVRDDCVVELVGLEPTTRVLWNAGMSDQLIRSNTMHSSSNSSFGHFHKGEPPVAPECVVEISPYASGPVRKLDADQPARTDRIMVQFGKRT